MAKDNIHRLQDTFLEHLLRRRTPVTIFLANGVRLQGVVAGFDAFCVLLERDGEQRTSHAQKLCALWTCELNTPDAHVCAVDAHSVKLPKLRDHTLHVVPPLTVWLPTCEP